MEYRRLLARAYAEIGASARGRRRAAGDHRASHRSCRGVVCAVPRLQRRGAGGGRELRRRIGRRSLAGPAARRCAARRRALHRCLWCLSRRARRAAGDGHHSRFHRQLSTSRRGTPDWAAIEREKGRLSEAQCAKRRALCAFRARRYRAALTAAARAAIRSRRYWRARAATELTKEALDQLDRLPDSRERREVRAAVASAERRYPDAVSELKAALQFAPKDPMLVAQLGTALYLSREYEPAIATLSPVVDEAPASDDVQVLTAYGDSLLQLDRVEDAVPLPAPRIHGGHVAPAGVAVAGTRLHSPGGFQGGAAAARVAARRRRRWQRPRAALARADRLGDTARRRRCSRSRRRSNAHRSSAPRRPDGARSRPPK